MTSEHFIPFNKPFTVGKELHFISQAVLSGQLAGNGKFAKLCQTWMEEHFHAKRVLMTHSCTAALEMSAILFNIKEGDEVVMPSYTFVSTANAFVLRGAKIKFVDIDADTLNMDVNQIESAINEKTKAICPVHYAGIACEMNTINALAKKYNLLVVEDAAQGLFSKYEDRYLGTIGDLGTYSFHETKNVISGEGGALVINNEEMIERAEIILEKGTNRSKFFRGQVDKYTWVDIGSSYLPSELISAFLYAQLLEFQLILDKRRAVFRRYYEELNYLATEGLAKLPTSLDDIEHNAHIFYLILKSGEVRDSFIKHLRKREIYSVFHYIPLHSSPMGLIHRACNTELPVTDVVSERLVRLPLFFDLTEGEQLRVISAVKEFFQ